MRVCIVKKWTSPDLMWQTPEGLGRWEGVDFTFDTTQECDAVIVLNHLAEPTRVRCAPENVWVLIQEPYVEDVFDWVVRGHKHYSRVFTHHLPPGAAAKYIPCQPAVPWHVNRSYDELKSMQRPDKKKNLSWITSNLAIFPGHRVRMAFLDYLRSRNLDMDLYGKGINFIQDKWDGLAPYRYSLAIENSSGPEYWTEKLADCFLSWTVPIYYGCANLEDYFPAESFIRIDITEPEKAYDIIVASMTEADWNTRLPALEEARRRVLERHQFFPQVVELVEQYHKKATARNLLLQPYKPPRNLLSEIRFRLSRVKSVLLGRAAGDRQS